MTATNKSAYDGVLHYNRDNRFRASVLECENGHTISAESAYISVQK